MLRCFFGGAGDEAILKESDESLITIAREELRRILGLTAAPLSTPVSRWPKAMAQYNVGHSARIAEIKRRIEAIPGLHLTGNAYDGIGLPGLRARWTAGSGKKSHAHHGRYLVSDDQVDVLEAIRRLLLKGAGHHTETADSPRAALVLAGSKVPSTWCVDGHYELLARHHLRRRRLGATFDYNVLAQAATAACLRDRE